MKYFLYLIQVGNVIEDKDYIIKELKKSITVLAKLVGLHETNQFKETITYNNELIELDYLENLLLEKSSLNQNEFALVKNILQAQFFKINAMNQI